MVFNHFNLIVKFKNIFIDGGVFKDFILFINKIRAIYKRDTKILVECHKLEINLVALISYCRHATMVGTR